MNKLFSWVLLAAFIVSPANAAPWRQLPSGGSVNSSTDQLTAVRSGTSLTSNTIAVGTQTFTTQSGLGYTSGQPISVVSTANSANFMQGTVSSYSGTTLSITVPITVPPSIGGAGTYSAWNIYADFQVTPTAPSSYLQPSNNLSDVSNAITALTNILPSQSGQAGKVLGSNGTAPSWVTAAGSGTVTTTGNPSSGNLAFFSGSGAITNGNLSGDCTTSGTGITACLKTGGVSFAPSATTDTTNAATISSGTLPTGRLPALTGDATMTAGTNTTTVAKINGSTLGTTTPTSGNILVGSGSQWATQSVSGDASLNSSGALTVTKTGGSSFAPSATTDTTNAGNISSGTLAPARLPNPTASSLGGTQSAAAIAHNFLTQLSTGGVFSQAQPAFTDLSGNIATNQMNGGFSASSSTYWRGDGTWAAPAGGAPSGAASGDLGGSYPGPTVTNVGHVSSGTLGLANGGSGQATAPAALQAITSGIMIDPRQYGSVCAGTTWSGGLPIQVGSHDDTGGFIVAEFIAAATGGSVQVPDGCWVKNLLMLSGSNLVGQNWATNYGYDYGTGSFGFTLGLTPGSGYTNGVYPLSVTNPGSGQGFSSSATATTSTTSNTIGTGSMTFTVPTGLNIASGNAIAIYETSNPANNMVGTITTYSQQGTSLVVNITTANGSGTYTDWNIAKDHTQTSNTIGTGTLNFTTTAVFPYTVGAYIELNPVANYTASLFGTVTASSGTSLTVNVTNSSGSGTYTDWNIFSPNTVTVSGGSLTSFTIGSTGSGYPANAYIPVPAGAGPGVGGAIYSYVRPSGAPFAKPVMYGIGGPSYIINYNGAETIGFIGFEINGNSVGGTSVCEGGTIPSAGFGGKIWNFQMSFKGCNYAIFDSSCSEYLVSENSDYAANSTGIGGCFSDFLSSGDTFASGNVGIAGGGNGFGRIQGDRFEYLGQGIAPGTNAFVEYSIVDTQFDHFDTCAINLGNQWNNVEMTGGALKAGGVDGSLTVTGTQSGTGGAVQLTVTSAVSSIHNGEAPTGPLSTGKIVTVSGVGGTTEANGTWTLTVVDGTHILLQGSTYANAYTSGGYAGVHGMDSDICMSGNTNANGGLVLSNVGYYSASALGQPAAPAFVLESSGAGVQNDYVGIFGGTLIKAGTSGTTINYNSFTIGVTDWIVSAPPHYFQQALGVPTISTYDSTFSISAAGSIGIGTTTPNANAALDMGAKTTAMILPTGTTGQEPTPTAGMIRYNTSTPGVEAYYGSAWNTLGGGGSGGITRSVQTLTGSAAAGSTPLTDYVYLMNCSSACTLTLPTAVSNLDSYTVKNVGTATPTIAFTGGQTGDGSSTIPLNVQNQSINLISNSANYNIY